MYVSIHAGVVLCSHTETCSEDVGSFLCFGWVLICLWHLSVLKVVDCFSDLHFCWFAQLILKVLFHPIHTQKLIADICC